MAKTELYRVNQFLSPFLAIQRFTVLLNKYKRERVMVGSKFKVEREAYATALLALGLMKSNSDLYWVGVNTEDSAPDTYLVQFRSTVKGGAKDTINVEVFEWEGHSKKTLGGAIKEKLKNKAYPNFYVLLCYVHGRLGELSDLEQLFQDFQKEPPKIAQIWIVSTIIHPKDNVTIVQLYPQRHQTLFRFEDEIERHRNQPQIIEAEFGPGKGFYDKGIKRIPLPELPD